uniref:Uncharacterized protein n=1 Tax=Onchocerca volvulus TaxID=6282 RepID=A0A8R1Y571_ONCVO
MSDETRPRRRDKSRNKENNEKSQKKSEKSKMQIVLKEPKEKKLKTTPNIDVKKDQKDNEGINKEIRKLRKDKSSSNHIINNAIDKTERSSSKNSRSNYQNLKASKLPVAELLSSPKILATSSTHVDKHNYKDDFEDYSDDFDEESETDSDKHESSNSVNSTGRNKKDKKNFEATRSSIFSQIGTSSKDALIDTTNDEPFSNSPLLHRIMNRQQSDENVQPLRVLSHITILIRTN